MKLFTLKKDTKDKHFLPKPLYPGGLKAMKQFIKEHLKYPKEALKHKEEGTVHLKYDINYKGQVVAAKVISGLEHGCNEEAIRLVKLLKFEVGKTRKVRILFHKKIRIHFTLPKKTPKKILYNYSSNSKKETNDKKPKGTGYSYTITIK